MSLNLETLQEPITRILTAPGTDLSTISAKRVRKTLLEDAQYAHLGLTTELLKAHRTDVDQAISRIFEHVNRDASSGGGGSKRKREAVDGGDDEMPPTTTEPSEDLGEGEDDEGVGAPTKSTSKRKKSKKSVEESDAALARRLSTEINSRSRRGPTMSAATSSPRKAKRKPKKSAETIESEEDDEDGEVKSKKRGGAKGGFAKEYTLSDPLSAVLATEKLSRPQVVKKLWEYIRQHELQNPSNRKEIICDNALRAVFAVDKIDMFRMNKVLGQHLYEGQ